MHKLKPLSLFIFFFALACAGKGSSPTRIALKIDVIGPENKLYRLQALPSIVNPEKLQAGSVKGLMTTAHYMQARIVGVKVP